MDDSTYVELLCAIREHSGMELDSIRQAGEYGADAGWPGFTYTSDGADFYRANQRTIVNLLAEDAGAYGYDNVASFVASFTRSDMSDVADGYECLCAWYVLESVGRYMEDRR